jgi:tyrosyl-tRNA synthetase
MDFIEEMKWRGMLQDSTPGVEEFLSEQKTVGYIGFDPTAPSLTIGNFVQIMILTLFQRSGHRPIVLMGGATGRIGDPSGKDKERELKTEEELDANLERQLEQVRQLLDFEDPETGAWVVNNLDHYKDMNILEFLRSVGKTLTINYMMSKDSVKKRLDTGLSFTEFSYQLLQAYDFQRLYEDHGCRLQMGGSDQWGNITSGTEFIRRNIEDAKAFAVTTPLLTKADGSKFGKSAGGNIWLSEELTSPYRFYQFWINADDADLEKYIKYFSLKSREEMLEMIQMIPEDPQSVKRMLAEELTERLHGSESLASVQKVVSFLFNRKSSEEQLRSLSIQDLEVISHEIPSFRLQSDLLKDSLELTDLMSDATEIVSSKGEARRAIKGNAVSLNKNKIADQNYTVREEDLIHNRFLLIDNGKKNKYILSFE